MAAEHDIEPRPCAADSLVSVAEQYGKPLERYLMRRLRDGQNVRDLAQEVYLRLLRTGKAELAAGDSPAYMYWIASHVLYEFKLRARRERVQFDSDALDALTEQPADVTRNAMEEELNLETQLDRALKSLPPTYRAVILLHKRDGLTFAEVAERLNLSKHTVKKYVGRALSALRAGRWEV
jgi:RNA polymerase sigma-70 factor (ECF subfamily)